jgi:uncharacterized protein YcbX
MSTPAAPTAAATTAGSVASLWRYPVKSMKGEELNATEVDHRGLVGDRAYAIVDPETGKVASAKHPKKWPRLFDCHASFLSPPTADALPAVRVVLPDGGVTNSSDPGFAGTLTAMLGRSGQLQSAVPEGAMLEEYWPDMEELEHRDEVTDEAMPEGTFFDLAPVHILTTGTLDALRAAHPSGRWEVRRFRPNIVVSTDVGAGAFPEAAWVGRTLVIGEVRFSVVAECPRCVMTTLAQSDLPHDPLVLRTAARENGAHVGVYAMVESGGQVRRGDPVTLI